MNVIDLFAGIGGFTLGLERAGMRTVAFCEINERSTSVLARHWPDVPIYGDVCNLTAERLHSDGIAVDLVTAGFPCQDASQANIDGEGTSGPRTGLYVEAIRLAGECGAAILMENVQNLFNRGFGDVLGALAEIGYDAEWEIISARDAGADHERKRLWIMGYPQCARWQGFIEEGGILGLAKAAFAEHGGGAFSEWRSLVSDKPILRGFDGVSIGLERVRIFAVGNAVTPYIPEAIGREIMKRLAPTA